MVLILFFFVMQAVIETLEKSLPSNNKPDFHFFLNDKGHLTGQRTTSAGMSFNILDLLVINDGTIPLPKLR